MEHHYIECDHCGTRDITLPASIGGGHLPWITVSRATSASGDRICAGIHHFCTHQCFMDFVAGKKYTQPKNLSPYPLVRAMVKAIKRKNSVKRRSKWQKDNCL